ncbi:MAG: DUF4238 domain-containing protein [Polaromonas sp.]|uniref:DUF4238 domain-containing protein n=1 Tax=Polaromonas sp. TaxID=1869339 RepID=UPI0025D0CAEC|nr:DUF4238 domain-containing protein [Polaromonas sp.]MBI2726751.1 DUF4238 domain-containing protein [Polaromonas sp.]
MKSQSQLSRRHHFVPQFYLRAWHGTDGGGLWLYGRKSDGSIWLRRRPAKAVAYLDDLYSFQPEGPGLDRQSQADVLETDFFSCIDEAAAPIHQKLIHSHIDLLSLEERCVWSLFLNSLLERSAKRILEIEKAVRVEDTVAKLARYRSAPQMHRLLSQMDVGAILRNSVLSALPGRIVDKPFVEYLANMRWNTVDMPQGDDHLLTGDMPLVVNAGQFPEPVYVLSIALSPRRMLVLQKQEADFDENFIRTLVVMHSIQVATQTERHLVSSRRLVDCTHIKYSKVLDPNFGIFNAKPM